MTHHAYNQNAISRSNVYFKYLIFMDKQDLISIPVGHVTKHVSFLLCDYNTRSAQKGELLVKAAVTEVHEKRCMFGMRITG